jgi:hypothetical protein
MKYMKVISTLVFCEIHENDFNLVLWNTWKWFQQWFCEIN